MRRRTAAALSLVALVAFAGALPAADAKKKKKKKVSAVTKSATVPLASGQTAATGAAACTGKTHMTGGGLAIAPGFSPPASGLRSVAPTSHPSGAKSWATVTGAFNVPAASGTVTTYVRCESNNAGQLVNTLSSTASLPPAQGTTFNVTCAPGTHVITGGYAGTGIGNPAVANNYRIIVLESRRTSARTWLVNAYNSNGAGTAATITAYATCERNQKGVSVSEAASASAPVVLNSRSSADATCAGKTHVVSGGFSVTPNAAGNVPGVTVDETFPVGKKGWHIGLFNLSNPPAGSAVQAFAYCKKG